ncbi:hypothetical protein E3E23_00460 [Thermococcus sp. CX2]|nr:hypothetical protein [Thermococcus sp. CX2]
MMWKKVIALLFGLMLITTTLAFGRVSAGETSVTVILVSDNEADCALAEYLANLTGAVVITTTWGVYDPNVTAEIMSYAPDEVIIIGGPDAVVDQYVEDLRGLNITVERWWGTNRYETNLAVINNATVKLKIKFENSVIVVPGNDTAGIEVALRKALKVHGIIIFANNSTDITKVMMKIQLRPKNMTIIRSHVMKGVAERVRERLREGAFDNETPFNVTEVEVNVTQEMALKAINMSEERITTAEELLANVTLPEQKEWLAEKMLNLAKKELERAKEAYDEGKYGRAYGQATAAKAHAEFVIRIASKEWNMKVKFDPMRRAEIAIHRLEAQIKVLEKAGIDVSELENLVEQLKAAIENNDVETASALLMKLESTLRELYMSGKPHIKGHRKLPVHGGAP